MSAQGLRDDGIYLAGVGAQTSVGRSAATSAAAVRCGLCAFSEHPTMVDRQGEPMVVARADWLDPSLPAVERVLALAIGAAGESLHPLAEQRTKTHCNLSLHVAMSAENLSAPEARRQVLAGLAAASGSFTTGPATELVDAHAGALLALANAIEQLRQGEADFCLVGGADSWLDPHRLEALDVAGRLHSVGNSWGFTPGEGAGFLLVSTGKSTRQFGLTALGEVLAVGTAQEGKPMGSKAVCIGEGLTAAFRRVLDPSKPVSHSYCDLNGEPYRADEFGFAVCRNRKGFDDAGSFTAAAECWGDVGAASGTLGIALPLAAWSRGYSNGPVSLVWCSSASRSQRAAVLLRQVPMSQD